MESSTPFLFPPPLLTRKKQKKLLLYKSNKTGLLFKHFVSESQFSLHQLWERDVISSFLRFNVIINA